MLLKRVTDETTSDETSFSFFVNSERLAFYRFSKNWNFWGLWRKSLRFLKNLPVCVFLKQISNFFILQDPDVQRLQRTSFFVRQIFDWKPKRIQLHVFFSLQWKHSKLLQPDIQRLRCNSLFVDKIWLKAKTYSVKRFVIFLKTIYNLKHSKTIQKAYKTRDKISKKHLKVLVQFLTSAGKPLHFAHFS